MRCSDNSGRWGRTGGKRLTPVVLSLTPFLLVLALTLSCGDARRLSDVRTRSMSASLQLPEAKSFVPEVKNVEARRDTLTVTDLDGREVLIMRAVKDEESGEMVATEQLQAAVVTARFRNVAERRGKIDLEFQVRVPPEMVGSEWQLRLHPDMFVMGDSLRLDDVLVTGEHYRRSQLRGYEQYEMFLSRIVSDTTLFIDRRALEIFLERNIPDLYAFRTDSSYVSDEVFASVYGVTEAQAVEHYTNRFLVRRNERLKGRIPRAYERYVRSPIVTEGIRLDTVMRGSDGEFVYNYVQTISTRPGLRKVDITLGGEICDREDRRIYDVPRSEPLTFYISSVTAFVDGSERYLTKVISRSASADTECSIDFDKGRSEIREDLSGNAREIDRIKSTLRRLLTDGTYELDSVTIAASASPEGSEKTNSELSYRRAKSASDYFSRFIGAYKDSLRREEGLFITVGDDLSEGKMTQGSGRDTRDISFISRSGGENWTALDDLVGADPNLSDSDRLSYSIARALPNPDDRERRMSSEPWFPYVRENLYPKLRTVRFRFALHRRGMIRDTVHTTVLDTAYMRGVALLRDHEYESALEVLRPYADFNTAVAYVAMDYNRSALSILETLPRSAPTDYMLALVYSRLDEDGKAVEHYLNSCRQDPSFVSRGNLDPEISVLIDRYGLNAEPEDDNF